jgi:hypothetical protein
MKWGILMCERNELPYSFFLADQGPMIDAHLSLPESVGTMLRHEANHTTDGPMN